MCWLCLVSRLHHSTRESNPTSVICCVRLLMAASSDVLSSNPGNKCFRCIPSSLVTRTLLCSIHETSTLSFMAPYFYPWLRPALRLLRPRYPPYMATLSVSRAKDGFIYCCCTHHLGGSTDISITLSELSIKPSVSDKPAEKWGAAPCVLAYEFLYWRNNSVLLRVAMGYVLFELLLLQIGKQRKERKKKKRMPCSFHCKCVQDRVTVM